MDPNNVVAIAEAWQDAANNQDVKRLLELSDPNIEIVGPRGSAHGHDILKDWLSRAGLQFGTLQVFAKDDVVVAAQHGVWRSLETNEVTGEANVATVFRVTNKRVIYLARYDSLEEALGKAEMSFGDERVSES
jgi:SnoaL-like domain